MKKCYYFMGITYGRTNVAYTNHTCKIKRSASEKKKLKYEEGCKFVTKYTCMVILPALLQPGFLRIFNFT